MGYSKSMEFINYPSKNFDDRPPEVSPLFLILHGTEVNLKDSLRILTDTKSSYPVSCHYMIDEQGRVYAMVHESKRAWHAGKSRWSTHQGLNAPSIGIELVNIPGTSFPLEQMTSLISLCQNILRRYPIKPHHVLAHSDISLGRKEDPGPLLNWKILAEKGIGLHPLIPSSQSLDSSLKCVIKPDEIDFSCSSSTMLKAQQFLSHIGYAIETTGQGDILTYHALKAFQMKFRSSNINGHPDEETLGLLKKYCHFITFSEAH